MKRLTLSLLSFFVSLTLIYAQGTPVEVWGSYSAALRYTTEFNGKLFFGAGNELWCTDGSGYGSQQVKAFGTGFSPYGFTQLNGKLYFIVTDADHGSELWVSDGTSAGTTIVKDINPFDNKSAFPSSPGSYTSNLLQVLGGKLYFIADDSLHGNELWVSDGTDAGTQMVKDIFPVADSNGIPVPLSSTNEHFLRAGNKIFFQANDGSGTGVELWSTDGTASGTQMVKNIVPGASSSNPRFFASFNDKVIFTIDSSSFYQTCYISDGTAAGTFGIADGYSSTSDGVIMNNKFYFVTIASPWAFLSETDGTWLNTNIVDTIGNSSYPLFDLGRGTISLTQFNNKLYFRNYFYPGSGNGSELWQSDGTHAGTGLLKDMYPGDYSSTPYGFAQMGDKLYFKTDDSLFVNINYTDGTVAGTQKIIMPGHNYKMTGIFQKRQYLASPIIPIGNKLYFVNPYDTTVGVRIYHLDMFPAGINGQPEISSIDIYPNPTQGTITVDAENAKSISIHSINGSLVYSKENITNTKHTVDTHNFATGTYTITTLLSDGTKRYGKFVKQ
jgi:ELWxxDGT repeat protein